MRKIQEVLRLLLVCGLSQRQASLWSTPAQPALALPPGWDELAGLRETYLYHFSRPEDVAALQHVIALVLELHLESPRLPDPDGAPPAGTPTRLELAAVTRDLRYCQGFLQQVARGPELSSLSPVAAALSRFAGKQADALALIASALERALG